MPKFVHLVPFSERLNSTFPNMTRRLPARPCPCAAKRTLSGACHSRACRASARSRDNACTGAALVNRVTPAIASAGNPARFARLMKIQARPVFAQMCRTITPSDKIILKSPVGNQIAAEHSAPPPLVVAVANNSCRGAKACMRPKLLSAACRADKQRLLTSGSATWQDLSAY